MIDDTVRCTLSLLSTTLHLDDHVAPDDADVEPATWVRLSLGSRNLGIVALDEPTGVEVGHVGSLHVLGAARGSVVVVTSAGRQRQGADQYQRRGPASPSIRSCSVCGLCGVCCRAAAHVDWTCRDWGWFPCHTRRSHEVRPRHPRRIRREQEADQVSDRRGLTRDGRRGPFEWVRRRRRALELRGSHAARPQPVPAPLHLEAGRVPAGGQTRHVDAPGPTGLGHAAGHGVRLDRSRSISGGAGRRGEPDLGRGQT